MLPPRRCGRSRSFRCIINCSTGRRTITRDHLFKGGKWLGDSNAQTTGNPYRFFSKAAEIFEMSKIVKAIDVGLGKTPKETIRAVLRLSLVNKPHDNGMVTILVAERRILEMREEAYHGTRFRCIFWWRLFWASRKTIKYHKVAKLSDGMLAPPPLSSIKAMVTFAMALPGNNRSVVQRTLNNMAILLLIKPPHIMNDL